MTKFSSPEQVWSVESSEESVLLGGGGAIVTLDITSTKRKKCLIAADGRED